MDLFMYIFRKSKKKYIRENKYLEKKKGNKREGKRINLTGRIIILKFYSRVGFWILVRTCCQNNLCESYIRKKLPEFGNQLMHIMWFACSKILESLAGSIRWNWKFHEMNSGTHACIYLRLIHIGDNAYRILFYSFL